MSLVCEYCSSTIVRTGFDIQLVGQVSAIVDSGSPILLGGRGRYRGVPFEIAGRLQVAYARGTWSEWYVEFADRGLGWLVDAQGQYSMLRAKDPRVAAGRVPPFAHVTLGTVLTIDGVPAVVVDKRAAAYQGAEGTLPFAAQPGIQFFGVDLRGYQGEFVSLDYGSGGDHNHPAAYMGEAVDLADLHLHPLRTFTGWPPPRSAAPSRAARTQR